LRCFTVQQLFSGLRRKNLFINHYNQHWKAMHLAFKRRGRLGWNSEPHLQESCSQRPRGQERSLKKTFCPWLHSPLTYTSKLYCKLVTN